MALGMGLLRVCFLPSSVLRDSEGVRANHQAGQWPTRGRGSDGLCAAHEQFAALQTDALCYTLTVTAGARSLLASFQASAWAAAVLWQGAARN